MGTQGYTVLGWLVWQIGKRVARRKLAENRAKLSAAAIVTLVVIGGVAAAKAGTSED